MSRTNFDLDVLRSFVTGIELGSYAKASTRLGRSTSAISAQLKKLEEQAGTPIFRKAGRGLALSEAGETMLAYARRLLDLNDEAADALRAVELEGWVRLGLQEDFGEVLLPEVLGRFARAHPKLKIEARVGRNADLLQRIHAGSLDLALAWDDGNATAYADRIADLAMHWVGPRDPGLLVSHGTGEPLPLVAFDGPCLFRMVATAALDRAGQPWRLSFTSANLAGLWAATAAGLGMTVRTELGVPEKLCIWRSMSAPTMSAPTTSDIRPLLPDLPRIGLVLHRAEEKLSGPTARLAEIITASVQEAVAAISVPQVARRAATLKARRRA